MAFAAQSAPGKSFWVSQYTSFTFGVGGATVLMFVFLCKPVIIGLPELERGVTIVQQMEQATVTTSMMEPMVEKQKTKSNN